MSKDPSAEQIGWALDNASEEQLINAIGRRCPPVQSLLKENQSLAVALLSERLETFRRNGEELTKDVDKRMSRRMDTVEDKLARLIARLEERFKNGSNDG